MTRHLGFLTIGLGLLFVLFAPKLTFGAAIFGEQLDHSGSIDITYDSSTVRGIGGSVDQTAGSSTLTLWIVSSDYCYLHLVDSERPVIKGFSDAGYTDLVSTSSIIAANVETSPLTTVGEVVFYLDKPAFWKAGINYEFDNSAGVCGDRSHSLTIGADETDLSPYFIMGSQSVDLIFSFPWNGETTNDYPQFQWQLSALGLDPSSYYVSTIAYTQASSSITYQDTKSFTTDSSTTDMVLRIKKQNALNAGVWSAHAMLFEGASTTEIANTDVTFTISSSTPILTPDCNFTSSSFLADPVGNIKQGICGAFVWGFFPSAGQQADLSADIDLISNNVKNKPPFGYFTSISNAFNSLSEGSTSLSLMDASTTATFSSVFSPLKIGFEVILWFLFGYWLFNWARKIQL